VKDVFTRQTLKEPKLVQLGKMYKWFTAVHSKGKPMTRPIIEKAAFV
jgi:hypothetical protein